MSLEKERIMILAGGPSCEREISLLSGRAVCEALKGSGLCVDQMDPAGDFVRRLKEARTTVVFLALHGSFGEDGTVQRLLDAAGIPYTGSGAEAAARAFDKSAAQTLFKEAGLLVPSFRVLTKADPPVPDAAAEFPLVVKPAAAGSSVGIRIVTRREDFAAACREAWVYSDALLAERYVQGRELTVGILGDEALPPVEVIPSRLFYDYQAKYHDSGTRYECPARLTPSESRALSDTALKAYCLLGCEVMARADFILTRDGRPCLLEVNTIPGLTGKSLLPKAAHAKGIAFPDLCVKILQLSLNRLGVRK